MSSDFITRSEYKKDMDEVKLQNQQILDIVTPMAKIFEGVDFTTGLIVKLLKFLAIIGAAVGAVIYLYNLISHKS